MFEGLDLGGMSKMMEQMQEKAKQMQEQAKNVQFTAKAGGGLVSVTVNGAGEVIDVNIDDSLLEDKSALQILLISAINEATTMAEENKKSQAMGMMGGLNPFAS
ncbi:MAG TPA: YbaB/EbfC family nucleoid-associated protein [Sulfurovum sp.]|jgi:DNA-binding YbaB/EbfC family protein|nr:MAG: nucleoid-associated protein, YbaB/EbfC family [Sulfurovum sp. 35-42-20]OYY56662.1 MAG: nucleoid-associated protein, YbaB/EbfC family [Sulfurovum sp. 28-43-6]OYZ24264.1 MAG: nucleoid-associated protein, YbaB/EbfC family [Sulfurovum sp. 16-42-52]OYZ49225.1 MAG: nucleoid-associated protein, YbaB/EbfC family [Sulfurovum sp. 24-42-9]OZA61510.1 MAG: nucleoid-associated protein, YbaB/EbfC family [Sulfurovum sp. 39-42-12]HQR72988.1 YbaB/EbfC family nucleoid-associated protein [Sulfurovum sp.]